MLSVVDSPQGCQYGDEMFRRYQTEHPTPMSRRRSRRVSTQTDPTSGGTNEAHSDGPLLALLAFQGVLYELSSCKNVAPPIDNLICLARFHCMCLLVNNSTRLAFIESISISAEIDCSGVSNICLIETCSADRIGRVIGSIIKPGCRTKL